MGRGRKDEGDDIRGDQTHFAINPQSRGRRNLKSRGTGPLPRTPILSNYQTGPIAALASAPQI